MDCLKSGDHNMLTFNVNMKTKEKQRVERRYNYNKADFAGMKTELGGISWDNILKGNTEEIWIIFKEVLLDLERKYVPMTVHGNRSRKAIWMTNRAMNMVAKKRKVFAKYKDRNHPAVREVNRKTTKALDDEKMNFEEKTGRKYQKSYKVILCLF